MSPANLTLAPSLPTEDRASYIGGSRIPAIVGVCPFNSPLDVWAEVHGYKDRLESEAAEAGLHFERPILDLHAKRAGLTITIPGTVRHPVESWVAATPDGLLHAIDQSLPLPLSANVKMVGIRNWKQWGDPDDGPEGLPLYVLCQKQWELFAQELPQGRVLALIGTEIRVYDVPRDDELIAYLHDIGHDFYKRCIVGGEMPRITGKKSARDILTNMYPKNVRGLLPATDDVRALAKKYRALAEAVERAEYEKEEVGNRLREVIGDAEGYAWRGGNVTWKVQKGTPHWRAVAMELGATADLVAKHTGAGPRVLRVNVSEGKKKQ